MTGSGFQKALERITDPAVRRRVRDEEKMATALVDHCLAQGWTISVHDGEASVVMRSTDRDKILGEMFATDEDILSIRDRDTRLGWFQLIYGNSAYDVVSDFSDNTICNEIWETVLRPLSDQIEEGLA